MKKNILLWVTATLFLFSFLQAHPPRLCFPVALWALLLGLMFVYIVSLLYCRGAAKGMPAMAMLWVSLFFSGVFFTGGFWYGPNKRFARIAFVSFSFVRPFDVF
jgi:hypothetical protein